MYICPNYLNPYWYAVKNPFSTHAACLNEDQGWQMPFGRAKKTFQRRLLKNKTQSVGEDHPHGFLLRRGYTDLTEKTSETWPMPTKDQTDLGRRNAVTLGPGPHHSHIGPAEICYPRGRDRTITTSQRAQQWGFFTYMRKFAPSGDWTPEWWGAAGVLRPSGPASLGTMEVARIGNGVWSRYRTGSALVSKRSTGYSY